MVDASAGRQHSKRRKIQIGDLRREELTSAALNCIVQKGYHNVRLEDVAEEAGFSKGVAFYYFGKKEELLISVLKRMWDDLMGVSQKVLGVPENIADEEEILKRMQAIFADPGLDFHAFIDNGLRVIFSWLAENTDILKVVLEFWCEISRNPMVAGLTQSMQAMIRKSAELFITEGIKRGTVRSLDPVVAADTLISSLHGIAFCYVVGIGNHDLSRLEMEAKALILRYLDVKPC